MAGHFPSTSEPWAQYLEAREQNKQNTGISIWKFLSTTEVKLTVCVPSLEITPHPKREKSTDWERGNQSRPAQL